MVKTESSGHPGLRGRLRRFSLWSRFGVFYYGKEDMERRSFFRPGRRQLGTWQFSGKFLSRVRENFSESGMVMGYAEKIVNCAMKVHDGN